MQRKRPQPLGSVPAIQPTSARVHCEGWIRKRGAGLLHGYKKRWFELHGKFLYYFKAKGTRPIGVLNVTAAKLKTDQQAHSNCEPGEHPTTYSYLTTLEGPYLTRKYLLLIEDGRECARWVRSLALVGVICFDSSASQNYSSLTGEEAPVAAPSTPSVMVSSVSTFLQKAIGIHQTRQNSDTHSHPATPNKANPPARWGTPPPGTPKRAQNALSDVSTCEGDDEFSDTTLEFIKRLGCGAFGSVDLCVHRPTGRRYAVKSIRCDDEGAGMQHELSVLPRLSHPFIVTLHHAYISESKEAPVVCMVLDHLGRGDLLKHLRRDGRFSEDRARFYSAEISSAIAFLHNHDIAHRDLKPDNCVLDTDGHVVLTDFGLAKSGLGADQPAALTFCGTPEYVAPELLKGQGATKAADWWSWGVMLFEMLTGRLPFSSQHPGQLYDQILSKPADMSTKGLTPNAVTILQKVLQREHDQRLQSHARLVKEQFFACIDWNLLNDRALDPPHSADLSDDDEASDPQSPLKSGGNRDPFGDFTWHDDTNLIAMGA